MGIVERVGKLNVWTRGDQRAPHKPLLLLYVLGQYLNHHQRMISFREIEAPLRQLLIDFGPPRKTYHPELPFWHLHSEGFWDLENVELPKERIGSASVKKRLLIEGDAQGGLSPDFFHAVQDPAIAAKTIAVLLEENFPESIHEDILRAVGIDLGYLVIKRRRDPKFREEIPRAYQYTCAICGFSSRLGQVLVGLEAAHIKWHQAGGPDTNPNGVALCALHHKLFDRGMIAFSEDLRIIVSETATGSAMFEHLVSAFHGKEITMPVRREYDPDLRYIKWHVKEVFHAPPMFLKSA